MNPQKIVIITTSHNKMGELERRTGLWLESLATPYYIFREAGAIVTVASLTGGIIPLDPKSESLIVATSHTKRFLKDLEAGDVLIHSNPLNSLRAEDFDGVLLAGGHGAIWDFPGNSDLKKLLEDFDRQHKLIAALDHGVAALLSLQKTDGTPFVSGRSLTASSNKEEELSGLTKSLPFLLESGLVDLGGTYIKGSNYASHMVVDGLLITGQNPASSGEVAKRMLLALKMRAENPAYAF